ncbi:hypothetical protein HDU79_004445 [Rhizoclosmatium sp. JEL0117]|nr:hypothetical protein HDU79_004445 [Rhizoclosmatium sp. JEL0117]
MQAAQPDLNQVVKEFRFPNPATTSMGIDFSDSEGSDANDNDDNEVDDAGNRSSGDFSPFGGSKNNRKTSDDDGDFNPFKPLANPNKNSTSNKGAAGKKVSSADLHSQIHQLEQLMTDSGFTEPRERRRSSAAIVEAFMDSEEAKKTKDSYRQSTQSLLQFLLDSRTAMNMAASSPLPTQSNIFRGTDFVVKNSNRLSTAISSQSSRSNRLSYIGSGPMSESEYNPDIDFVEQELLGDFDSSELSSDYSQDEAQDTITSIQSNSKRNTAASATLRLLMDNEEALRVLQDTESASSGSGTTARPRISNRKRTSVTEIESNLPPPSPSSQNPPVSPTLSPDAKRRRSIPAAPGLMPPPAPRPRTVRPPTANMPPTPSTPPQQGNNTTLLNIIINLPTTHFAPTPSNAPGPETILTLPRTVDLSTTTITDSLITAATHWRHRNFSLALASLHACAVVPWIRKVHDPETGGGITRSSVHPSAVALYILAMCLFEGIATRRDASLGVLVLEMAAGVAVEDGGGRGEEALRGAQREQQMEAEAEVASVTSGISVDASEISGGGSHPARKASLGGRKRPVRGDSVKNPAAGMQYYALADPAWSLVDSFGQGASGASNASFNGDEIVPTPSGGRAAKRLSALHSLTPIEFLRLPTLRLAECYELGRGVKRSQRKAAYYYQVWNALGGGHTGSGNARSIATRSSFSSGHSSNLDSGASTVSGSQSTGQRVPLTAEEQNLKKMLKKGLKSGLLAGGGGALFGKKK